MVDLDVLVSNHLKEELTWAIDKWLQVISTIMLLKNSKSIRKIFHEFHIDFSNKSLM